MKTSLLMMVSGQSTSSPLSMPFRAANPISIDKHSGIPALSFHHPGTLASSRITGHLPSALRLMPASGTTSNTCPLNSSTIQTTSLPESVWRTALHRSGHCGLGSVFSLTATFWPLSTMHLRRMVSKRLSKSPTGRWRPRSSSRNSAEVPEVRFPRSIRRSLPQTRTCRPHAAKLPVPEWSIQSRII